MLIRWGQMSLLALLAVFTLFIIGDVRDAASQDDADASADAAADGIVEATGRVESAETVDVRSEVPGTHAIAEIVADGTEVKTGDLIVKLDDSSLQAELAAHGITVAQARAGVERAQARLGALNADAESNRQALALRLEIAELELRRYQEAGLPLEIARLEGRIEVAQELVAALRRRVERLEARVSEDAGAEEELEIARVEQTEAQANLELAHIEQRMLTDYEGPLQTKKLELQISEARTALEQTDRSSAAGRAEAEAGLAAAEVAVVDAEQQLSGIREAIEKCSIYAPRDGIVLHAATYSRRATSNTLHVGSEVREGQPLIRMPNLSRLRVRLHVDEVEVAAVQVGQPVSLLIGDTEEQRLGTVSEIGARQPYEVYPSGSNQPPRTVFVEFNEPPAGLRFGAGVGAMIDVSGVEDE